jgi:hypothetical protein
VLEARHRAAPASAALEGHQVVSVVALCLVVWVWRRPEQLVRPYVWVEESHILRNFLADGWLAAVEPVQGYLILPATALVTLAAELSFVHVPGLMYLFSSAVFATTVLLLVIPDSRWGDRTTRSLMALAASLVPTNPEVFGVLLYSFWWTTLWPLIALGWTQARWALRAPILALGALSSPAGAALFVVFAVAYLRGRRACDAIGAGILFVGFVVQGLLTLTSDRGESLTSNATVGNVAEQVLRIGGLFETNWLELDRGSVALVGLLLLVFLLAAAAYVSAVAKRDEALLMALGAFVYTGLSAVPAQLITAPDGFGPRYFFLPFIAFSWTLLMLVRTAPGPALRVATVALLCVPLLNLGTTFSRADNTKDANLSWRGELERCATSTERVVPVQIYFDGSYTVWTMDMTPAQCRELSS